MANSLAVFRSFTASKATRALKGAFLMRSPQTGLSVANRVDAACDRFESLWRASEQPRIDDFVSDANVEDRAELRKALLTLQVELIAAAPPTMTFAVDAAMTQRILDRF